MDMENNLENNSENNVEVQAPVLEVWVSSDGMEAHLKVLSIEKQTLLGVRTVLEKLQQEGIRNGILAQEIMDFCARGIYNTSAKVAQGLLPIAGIDGTCEFTFESERDLAPKENEDGTIDFKNLGLIHNVQMDELLCTFTPPTMGVSGKNIFAQDIDAREGKPCAVRPGKNTYLSEDGLQVYAERSGSVQCVRGIIEVDDVLNVKGDVGADTGNIDFEGTVNVKGSILEGFSVKAKCDIVVAGGVEGCALTAGGNIVVKNGINGMKKAVLQAGGDVVCKFLELGTVICGGDFCCDMALNSNVEAGKSIKMKGSRGALTGGEYVAGESILAKNIGSEKSIKVNVSIDFGSEAKQQEIQDKLEELESDMQSSNAMKKEEMMLQKAKLEQELLEMREPKNLGRYRIVCTGKTYDGVKLSIGGVSLRIFDTLDHQSFYLDDGEIVMGAILPHEL